MAALPGLDTDMAKRDEMPITKNELSNEEDRNV
jgi:hypothetical protein